MRNPTSAVIRIESEPTEAPAPAAPAEPDIREMKNGTAIGKTSIAVIHITDAANATTIPTRALLR